MANILRPGVYVQETLNPIGTTAGPASNTVAAFIGANDRGFTVPTLVTSWNDYVTKFGSWNTVNNNDLPLAVYSFFINGGSQAYITRAIEAGADKATRTLGDRAGSPVSTLRLDAINEGTWGNDINVSISDSNTTGYFNLTVYFGGVADSNIVERFPDLTMVTPDARYAPSVINVSSKYITVTDLNSATAGSNKNPSVTSNQSLAAGADGAAVTVVEIASALDLYDVIEQSLLLNVPGFTDALTVNALISYAEVRNDVFVIIDGIDDTAANQLSLASTYTASSQAAVYYPQIVVSDPSGGVGSATNAVIKIGAGGAVMGLFVRTDASRGVYKAPAGLLARIAGAVSVPKLTNFELDSLNSAVAPVNAIKFVSGSGIVVMGARTLKAGYIDRYVPVRRTLIYLRKTLTDLTQFAVFEPNGPALWRRLNASISSFLTEFWSQGGLQGGSPANAFFVKIDSTNNPQNSIDNGEVNIEVGVALQRPAEFVVIKIGQFDGGTTVTVA
jgi:phage tail sheath protein FI